VNLPRPFAAFAVFAAVSRCCALDPTQWEFRQSFGLPAAGPVRIALPAEMLDAARADRADLRLLGPDGAELAFTFVSERPTLRAAPLRLPVQARLGERCSVLEFTLTAPLALARLRLETPAPAFLKGATVELQNAAGSWTTVVDSALIFRGRNGAEHLAFELGSREARAVRVTVEDERTGPVPFTAGLLEPADSRAAAEVFDEIPVSIAAADSAAGESRLTLDLGLRHRPLAELVIDPRDPVFQRPARLLTQRVAEEQVVEETLAAGVIGRIELPGSRRFSRLALPVDAPTPNARLELAIDNGDSPPLAFGHITARLHRVQIGFVAPAAGAYTLLAGAPAATAPRYDVAAFATDWAGLAETPVIPAGRTGNPDFRPLQPVLDVPATGGPIMAADWTQRRPVTIAEPGAQVLELDADAIGRAQPDLADLRLARGDWQVPYLLERESRPRTAVLALVPAPDPQRPTVGRWELALPVAGLPLTGLRLTVAEPIFSRHVQVGEIVEDARGRPGSRSLGSATIERQGADAPATFTIPLQARPQTAQLVVEIDHGDNAAFAPVKTEATFLVRRLHFRAVETAACVLLYGNPHAAAPRYDLQLAAPRLLAAPPHTATLAPLAGAAEAPDRGPFLGGRVGRFAFWAALALVVIVLVALVAKLLPKPPTAGSS